jgi:hypothetical protein
MALAFAVPRLLGGVAIDQAVTPMIVHGRAIAVSYYVCVADGSRGRS